MRCRSSGLPLRAEAQLRRDTAAAAGQETTGYDELIDELDTEITLAGVRGKVATNHSSSDGRQSARRSRSTRRRQDAAPLPARKIAPRTTGRVYTALKALSTRPLSPLPETELDTEALAELRARIDLAGIDGPRLVFVNGHFHPGLSRLETVDGLSVQRLANALDAGADGLCVLYAPGPRRRDRVDALNAAFAADGAVIRVAPGARIAPPVHVVHVHAGAPSDGFHFL